VRHDWVGECGVQALDYCWTIPSSVLLIGRKVLDLPCTPVFVRGTRLNDDVLPVYGAEVPSGLSLKLDCEDCLRQSAIIAERDSFEV
jgi:hypothetical protein